jgi:adenosine deaminase
MSRPRTGLTEIHRHVDGSMRRSTLEALAAERGITVPVDLGFTPGMGLESALACFALTLSCLDTAEALARVAREMCEDAAAEGVSYLEMRFGPMLHAPLAPTEAVEAVASQLTGDQWLILCGLYGDPPAVFEQLVDLAVGNTRAVGIDIAGSPSSMGQWRIEDYAPAFRRAKQQGIGITVHTGEGRPAAEIEEVLEKIEPDRLGHATTLLESERATALVRERGIAIEACLTSNVHAGAIRRVEDHPLPRWLQQGLRVILCADNTLFSTTTIPEEIEKSASIPGMSPELLSAMLGASASVGFAR